tara:strand:+ start:495 stop:746 length:252 start_codon:yes stop_codon:yes gene_type:complete
MLTDFYYLQEKIREMREMIFCNDLDEVFDRVPSGVKTRNDIVKNLDEARTSLARSHLAWLSASKRSSKRHFSKKDQQVADVSN